MDWFKSIFLLVTVINFHIKSTYQNDLIKSKIVNDGYGIEKHEVETLDGYYLQIIRLVNKNVPMQPRAPVILIMHGLFGCAGMFVAHNSKENILPYILLNAGYDVWLGNARGTSMCQKHKNLDIEKDAIHFWNYTMDEIGKIDMPATIDYILEVTKQDSLNYIGYSMGGTVFFIMLSTLPEYNKKISRAYLIAPAVYMKNMDNLTLRNVANNIGLIEKNLNLWGLHRFGFHSNFSKETVQTVCHGSHLSKQVCKSLLVGPEKGELSMDDFLHMVPYTLDMVSTKQLLHYQQFIKSEKFGPYCHENCLQNDAANELSSEYNLTGINVPVVIFYGSNDTLVPSKTSEDLLEKVKTIKDIFIVKDYNHLDVIFGKNTRLHIFNKILDDLNDGFG